MAYTKTTWQDLPNQTTPINATNLNNIENGIKTNDDKLLGNAPMGNIVVDSIKSKNVLPINANSTTFRGITYIVNKDKTISVNGTATGGDSELYLRTRADAPFEAGTYTLTGCPSGGSSSTYNIYISPSIANSRSDVGSGVTLTLQENETNIIKIIVKNGTTVNNLLFKPMLEKGSTATDYAPYQKYDFDYEEGSWTPTITTTENIAPTVTYTTQRGSYKKIGNIVYFDFYIKAKITALNGTNNYARVSGLPFAAKSLYLGEEAINCGVLYSALADTTNVKFNIQGTSIRPMKNYGTSAVPWVVTSSSYMEIGGSGFYFTN